MYKLDFGNLGHSLNILRIHQQGGTLHGRLGEANNTKYFVFSLYDMCSCSLQFQATWRPSSSLRQHVFRNVVVENITLEEQVPAALNQGSL